MARKSKQQIKQEAKQLLEENPELQIRNPSTMAHMNAKQKHAYQLYVVEGWDVLKDIAEQVDVDPSTVSRWKDKFGWEELREQVQYSPEFLAAELKKIIKAELYRANTKAGGLDAGDIDKLVKLVSLLEKLSPKKNFLGSILMAIREWFDFLAAVDPDLYNASQKYLTAFSNTMAEKYE